jgi:SAM-dependent methyltransferase
VTARDDISRWDAVALEYAARVGGEADSFYRRFGPFLWDNLGDTGLAGKRILDLGCGHGWLAGILAGRGATVVGVDGSPALIEKARTTFPEIGFSVHDLTERLPADLGQFDAVISHMVLMDVPTIDPIMASVSSLLRPGGAFVFTILHPSFFAQPIAVTDEPPGWERRVSGYLDEKEWTVDSFGGHTHYHRPLSHYVESATAHGLVIAGLDEPPSLPSEPVPTSDWNAYQRWFASIPTMLSVACRK